MSASTSNTPSSSRAGSGTSAAGEQPRGVAGNHPVPRTEWGRILGLREMGVYYALVLLIFILSMVTAYSGRTNYLSLVNMTNVLYQSSLVGIMAVAMTVVLITGNFDLSVASVAALAGAVLVGSADTIGFWPAFCAAMLVAVAVGLLNGSIVQLLGINAFIVTLGTLTAIRGLVLIVTDGRSLSADNPVVGQAMRAFESSRVDVGWPLLLIGAILVAAGLYAAIRSLRSEQGLSPPGLGMILSGLGLAALVLANDLRLLIPSPVIYMALFSGIVWFVLTRTVIGRRVYAVGGNAEAARLCGINVTRYKMLAFVLSSASAGFAGILFASRLRSINPAGLQGAELTVIASAILGGTSLYGGAGSVIRTLAGALLLFALTNGFNILNLGANYQGVIEGTVVVIAAAIYTVGGSGKKVKPK